MLCISILFNSHEFACICILKFNDEMSYECILKMLIIMSNRLNMYSILRYKVHLQLPGMFIVLKF